MRGGSIPPRSSSERSQLGEHRDSLTNGATMEKRTCFSVSCILCGETDTVRIHLGDSDTLSCSACENEFSVSDVRAHVAEWSAVLKWIDMIPTLEVQP